VFPHQNFKSNFPTFRFSRGERILTFLLLIHILKIILHIHIQSLSKNFWNSVSVIHTYLIAILANYKTHRKWLCGHCVVCTRDDHYPVCRLDTRQDSEFATGYGYPKSALKREQDMDPDIRNAFIDISRIQNFGKSCTLHNHWLIIFIQKHLFSHLCHDSESVYGVFPAS